MKILTLRLKNTFGEVYEQTHLLEDSKAPSDYIKELGEKGYQVVVLGVWYD